MIKERKGGLQIFGDVRGKKSTDVNACRNLCWLLVPCTRFAELCGCATHFAIAGTDKVFVRPGPPGGLLGYVQKRFGCPRPPSAENNISNCGLCAKMFNNARNLIFGYLHELFVVRTV
jgi:hypothetical protein